MRRVIYSMTVSLDGFVAARDGDIGWSAPDRELHLFHNEQVRELGAYLCGRRLYETMAGWDAPEETFAADEGSEFARIWKSLPKIVFSRTLESVHGNATLATDEVADVVARLKQEPDGDIGVGGAGFASTLIRLDLVDEYRLFVSPIALGGGTPYFPSFERRIELRLLETRTFGGRVIYLRYARSRPDADAPEAAAT